MRHNLQEVIKKGRGGGGGGGGSGSGGGGGGGGGGILVGSGGVWGKIRGVYDETGKGGREVEN